MMIIKSISIRDDQRDWIVANSINLSWLVQKHLDDKMGDVSLTASGECMNATKAPPCCNTIRGTTK